MAFDAFKHAVHSRLKGAYEAVTPHQTESNFKTTGVSPAPLGRVVITQRRSNFYPGKSNTSSQEEVSTIHASAGLASTIMGTPHAPGFLFLNSTLAASGQASRYLSWESISRPRHELDDGQDVAESSNAQVVVVPSTRRAAVLEEYPAVDDMLSSDLSKDDDGWVATRASGYAGRNPASQQDAEIPDISSPGLHHRGARAKPMEDDIPDMDDLALHDVDDATAPDTPRLRSKETASELVRTRTYDLFISYDKSYAVPRFWLIGFDEDRQPLTTEQILKDVSEEHAKKTITVDPFPHGNFTAASIHPCKHASVMKKLSSMAQSGSSKELLVDHYLVLFLKFIASVIPTIEYDYTMSSVV